MNTERFLGPALSPSQSPPTSPHQVIKALSSSRGAPTHVPYRDSTLTKLLSDCLGGTAVTMMVACCTPLVAFADESLRTLQYACSAGSIRNRPVVKLDPQDQLISELRDEVQQLKATVRSLRKELRANGSASRLSGQTGAGLERNLSDQSLGSMLDRAESRAESRASSSRPDLRDAAPRAAYSGRTPLPTPTPQEARSVVVSLCELPDEPPAGLTAGYSNPAEGLAAAYRVPVAYQSPPREGADQVALIEARAEAEAALSRAAASEYRLRVEAKERQLQLQLRELSNFSFERPELRLGSKAGAPVARYERDGAPSPGEALGGGGTGGGGGGGRGSEDSSEDSRATPRVFQPAAPQTARPSEAKAGAVATEGGGAEERGSRSSREVALEQQLRALTSFSATDSILAAQRAAAPPPKPAAPAERTVSLGLSDAPPAELRRPAPRTAAEVPLGASGRLSELLAELERAPVAAPSSAQPSPQREYNIKAKALRAREYELERSLRALSKYSAPIGK